jgi:hypothetical protein
MIKFTYSDDHIHVSHESKSVLAVDLVDDFRRFLLAVGFQPETVAEVLPDAP